MFSGFEIRVLFTFFQVLLSFLKDLLTVLKFFSAFSPLNDVLNFSDATENLYNFFVFQRFGLVFES
jgi:hypothetical protein